MSSRRTPPTVGVTGHRPAGLLQVDQELLALRVREVLDFLALRFGQSEKRDPAPRLLSPLAEGADRLVARLALESGWQLVSVLPFPRQDYERDFITSDSRAEFSWFLAQAGEVRELGGVREGSTGPDQAYAAVGNAVLEGSDLLIALWDGERARGPGGTGEVVDAALARGTPVIWIDARPPHGVMVLPDRVGLGEWWRERNGSRGLG